LVRSNFLSIAAKPSAQDILPSRSRDRRAADSRSARLALRAGAFLWRNDEAAN